MCSLSNKQREQAAARLKRLAGMRATYTNLLSESGNREKLLERAEQGLNNARSTLAGAKTASLISAVDDPDTGTHPISPSRSLVILGGLFGGLLTGLGLVSDRAGRDCGAILRNDAHGPPGQHDAGPLPPPEAMPPMRSTTAESRSMTVGTQGKLNCGQALKILSERPLERHACIRFLFEDACRRLGCEPYLPSVQAFATSSTATSGRLALAACSTVMLTSLPSPSRST